MLSLLTDTDKQKIVSYIQYCTNNMAKNQNLQIEKILQHWDEAKTLILKDIFQNNLILSKRVSYTAEKTDIVQELKSTLLNDQNTIVFISKLKQKHKDTKHFSFVESLFLYDSLYKNTLNQTYVYDYEQKNYKFCQGMKIIKILRKLAILFNLEAEFEQFRLLHSQILNTKTLTGDLCLSIHPLDYLTMSDNNSNWSSCTSLLRHDVYCQGALEMMNSTTVVVGYLSSSNKLMHWGEESWNNKKWRTLLIVNNGFIISIKNYPYNNAFLTEQLIDWLAKLQGWSEVKYKTLKEFTDEQQITLNLETNLMYNDIKEGKTCSALVGVNPCLTVEENTIVDYLFSGKGQCICCGENSKNDKVVIQWSNNLLCKECIAGWICKGCNTHYADTIPRFTIAEGEVCEYCLKTQVVKENLTNQQHLLLNTAKLNLSSSNEGWQQGNKEIIFYIGMISGFQWRQFFNIPSYRFIKQNENSQILTYYVLPKDCTEKGLQVFGINSTEELNNYMRLN